MKKLIALLLLASMAACACGDTLTSTIQVTVVSNHTHVASLSTKTDTVSYSAETAFPNGSGTAQVADLVYHVSGTLADGASLTLDLFDGVSDQFGTVIQMARLKSILVENTGTTTLSIGSGSAPIVFLDPATATLTLQRNGFWSQSYPLQGLTVASETADQIHIENASGTGAGAFNLWLNGASH